MHISEIFQRLEESSFGTAIRESGVLFPMIESVHVLALTIVVGSISVVDLRLLGVASTSRSVASLIAHVLPLTWVAFTVAVLSGGSLFASHATGYAGNFQFRVKVLLLFFAALNMLCFHWGMRRGTHDWVSARTTPWPGRLAGAISLLLWIGIVAFGRWIGFADVK